MDVPNMTMEKIIACQISYLPLKTDRVGEEVEAMTQALGPGEVLLLENLRFHKGETKNDPEFAKALARLAEVYVNDAFAVSHRAHASVVGMVERMKECAAGFLLAREVKYLSKLLTAPERPVALVIGGAKVSTKIGVLKNLLPKIEKLFIGGAMANTFLKALGYELGRSFCEEDFLEEAREILQDAERAGVKVYLPVDVLVGEDQASAEGKVMSVGGIPPELSVYDLGPETVAYFSRALEGQGTIVLNGPMGLFENPAFAGATIALSREIASSNAVTIGGGGDTLRALKAAGVKTAFSYLSTGGGAFLEFLEGKTLPGVAALEKSP
jgi:phosphoglycerate kinase